MATNSRKKPESFEEFVRAGAQFSKRRDFKRALQCFSKALKLTTGVDLQKVSAVHVEAGSCCYMLRQYEKALYHYKRQLAAAKQSGRGADQAHAYANIGVALQALDLYDKALECFKKQHALAQREGDAFLQAQALDSIGACIDVSSPHHVFPVVWQEEDVVAQAGYMSRLGVCHREQGRYTEAIALFESVLALHEARGDRRGQAQAHRHLGSVYEAFADFEKSAQHFESYITLMRDLGDTAMLFTGYDRLGTIYERLSDRRQAAENYKAAMSLAMEAGNQVYKAAARRHLHRATDQTSSAAAAPAEEGDPGKRRMTVTLRAKKGMTKLFRNSFRRSQAIDSDVWLSEMERGHGGLATASLDDVGDMVLEEEPDARSRRATSSGTNARGTGLDKSSERRNTVSALQADGTSSPVVHGSKKEKSGLRGVLKLGSKRYNQEAESSADEGSANGGSLLVTTDIDALDLDGEPAPSSGATGSEWAPVLAAPSQFAAVDEPVELESVSVTTSEAASLGDSVETSLSYISVDANTGASKSAPRTPPLARAAGHRSTSFAAAGPRGAAPMAGPVGTAGPPTRSSHTLQFNAIRLEPNLAPETSTKPVETSLVRSAPPPVAPKPTLHAPAGQALATPDSPSTKRAWIGADQRWVAKYTHKSKEADNLSFKKGDVLVNLKAVSDDWFFGKNVRTTQSGLIPANYIEEEVTDDTAEA
ncbi:uncharacterized protein MONBRDRAFT_6110 [Monosiga brevicollis MX1]|uniref:SH3 domain-containing protein n=1 Tax=Monosiga brevicollis TaxID=81824 RepID=A9URL7_MONBE|nr:uncharacterized protein MONBRDRAFT_6110 [Monosiga brevicollis MX1]EDQ91946.1 predicted protein [Monosiga brevicollis MX1]|eukprot:XP_001743232.1 hypothetical protein [Monosiga brevicollis MX1]